MVGQALLIKETEKAIYVEMLIMKPSAEGYVRFKAWLPKSQIIITHREGDLIDIDTDGKNWVIENKLRDYLNYMIAQGNERLAKEFDMFLSCPQLASHINSFGWWAMK